GGIIQFRKPAFKSRWRSHELFLQADSIRQKHGRGDVTVLRDEVVGVVEDTAGLFVMTHQPPKIIAVPAGLSGYAEVRAHLSGWMPVKRHVVPGQQSASSLLRFGILPVLAALLLVRSLDWFL